MNRKYRRRNSSLRTHLNGLLILILIGCFNANFINQYSMTSSNQITQWLQNSILHVCNVKNQVITLNKGSVYTLPTKIGAKLSLGVTGSRDITWNKKLNTSVVGTQKFIGTVKGYNKPVSYTINILDTCNETYFGPVVTNNSAVHYNIDFGNATQWISLNYSKGSIIKHKFVPINNGIFNYTLYLDLGPGNYIVQFIQNNTASFYNNDNTFTIENRDHRNMSYLFPSKYVESDSPEIIKLAEQITQGCYSDMDETKAIHDWVAKNISYDTDDKNHEYSAIETLHGTEATCNGYANLTAALNRAIGIKAKICSGPANPSNTLDRFLGSRANTVSSSALHAWNETYVDNRWVIQDTTWDAGGVNVSTGQFVQHFSRKYFDLSPAEFAKTHTLQSEADAQ
jgi:hypothetical protein